MISSASSVGEKMTIKKTLPAFENTIYLDGAVLERRKISEKLIREANAFKKRNAIVVAERDLESKKAVYECCPACLKAHLIKKADEWNLDRDLSELLFRMVGNPTGHYGYYMDRGKIYKV